jgi:ATP-dependent DNA helicase 2 subunit 2
MNRAKEVEVIILDISPTMGCHLQAAKDALLLRVQHRLVYLPLKSEIGMLLLGSRETDNCLSSDGDYLYIRECRPIQQVDADMYKMILRVTHDVSAGDWLDAVIVAMDMIMNHCGSRKFEKRIVLITNASRPVRDSDQIGEVAQALLDNDIRFEFLCTPISPDQVKRSNPDEYHSECGGGIFNGAADFSASI